MVSERQGRVHSPYLATTLFINFATNMNDRSTSIEHRLGSTIGVESASIVDDPSQPESLPQNHLEQFTQQFLWTLK